MVPSITTTPMIAGRVARSAVLTFAPLAMSILCVDMRDLKLKETNDDSLHASATDTLPKAFQLAYSAVIH